MSELLDAALAYADLGYSVFPCWLETKNPKTTNGFYDASDDPGLIESWWAQWPDAPIGLRTGMPGGIFVVDIDPGTGGDDTLADLFKSYGEFPETPQVLTGGGGVHYWFKMPDVNLTVSGGALGPGIDTRGNGGYVIVPPSPHASGRTYIWEVTADLMDVPLADAPPWLIALLQEKKKEALPSASEPIAEGQRNATLTRVAGMLRRPGLSQIALEAALMAENEARCKPPLDEKEVKGIARSVARYAPNDTNRPFGMKEKKSFKPPLKEFEIKRIDGDTLRAREFAPLKWFAAGLIHEGNCIFAGKSKRGKSWLALNMAVSLATGQDVLGHYEVREEIKVALCALEDGERRLNRRLRQIEADKSLKHLEVFFTMPKLAEGGYEFLESLIVQERFQVVIIDVLAKVDGGGKNGAKDYQEVYDSLGRLQELRDKHTFALIMITHLRKAEAEEMSESIMGSTAYVGIQDVVWVFNRKYGESNALLEVLDKDMAEKSIEVEFDAATGNWLFVGEGDEHAQNKEEATIIDYLKGEHRPQTVKQTMSALGIPADNYHGFRKRMERMANDYKILRAGRGTFTALPRGSWEGLDDT